MAGNLNWFYQDQGVFLQANMDARVDLTEYVTIPVWYGCNNNCTICMLSALKKELPFIDFDTFKKLLMDVKNEGRYRNLVLSGAEITTFDDLEQYIQFAASLGWFKKIQIQTNGRKLRNRKYLKTLIDAGLNEFFISVQGLEETHDTITRTRGSFKETMEGFHHLSSFDVNVMTNTVLTKKNYQDIVPLMILLSKEAISEIHLWNFFPMESTDTGDFLVSMKDFNELLPQILSKLEGCNKPLVLKNLPQCLSIGDPGFFDSGLPVTLIHQIYWRQFRENRFGLCPYRDQCKAEGCWGLSAAYVQKYGDERDLLSPIREDHPGFAKSILNHAGRDVAKTTDRLEYTTDQDTFFNYCLYEYKPVIPFKNKLRSVNLLFHSFDVFRANKRVFQLVQRIREALGMSCTVWGVKQLGNDVAWEFYFYDYRREQRERSITKVLEAIRPMISCQIRANENFPYFMFSIDIDHGLISGEKSLEEIHMYIGNTPSTVSSGICYSLTSRGRRLENFYFFFNPKEHMKGLLNKVFCSAYIDPTKVTFDQILWPELRNCKTICIANKQNNDCVYYSGIHVDQFIFFLKRMKYNDELVSFVESNKSRLDHLQFDVGLDYRMDGKDLVFLKSGYYGNF